MFGRINKYYTERGFGFIEGSDNIDYYFHITDCVNLDHKERYELGGMSVSFNPRITNIRGIYRARAIDVTVLDVDQVESD